MRNAKRTQQIVIYWKKPLEFQVVLCIGCWIFVFKYLKKHQSNYFFHLNLLKKKLFLTSTTSSTKEPIAAKIWSINWLWSFFNSLTLRTISDVFRLTPVLTSIILIVDFRSMSMKRLGFLVNRTTFPNVQTVLSSPDGVPCIIRSDMNAHDETVLLKNCRSSFDAVWMNVFTKSGWECVNVYT